MLQRWFLLGILMSATAGLVGCGGGADDDSKEKISHQGLARWTQFPVEIYVDSRIADNPEVEADVLAALNFWESKASRRLFVYRGARVSPASGVGPVDPKAVPANQAFFEAPWPYASNMLALNWRVESAGTIQRSIISINDNYRYCHSGDCARDPRFSFRKVLAHEVGHFLGFDHHGNTDNIMFAMYQPGGSLEDLNVDWAAMATLIR